MGWHYGYNGKVLYFKKLGGRWAIGDPFVSIGGTGAKTAFMENNATYSGNVSADPWSRRSLLTGDLSILEYAAHPFQPGIHRAFEPNFRGVRHTGGGMDRFLSPTPMAPRPSSWDTSAIDRHYPLYGCLQYHTAHSNTPTENPFSILELPVVWLRTSLLAKDFHSYFLPRSINQSIQVVPAPESWSVPTPPPPCLQSSKLTTSNCPVNSVSIFVRYFCTPFSRFLVLRLALRALAVPWGCLW